MKRLYIILLLVILSTSVFAQALPERTIWQGQLGAVRLILRVYPDTASGNTIAVFDSPDQNASNLSISKFEVTADSLRAYSSVIGGGFSGRFNDDRTQITGNWKQGSVSAPLTLVRITSLAAPVDRKQTPKPPFPYKSENVEYSNSDKSVHFGGTLTLPDSDRPVPVLLLISGSGQQDRDETIFNHKPFAVIADHLTRNGIAVLRIDDRGVGQTTGDIQMATSADFAKDVLSGLAYLKSRKEVDSRKIGLLGHSEGGIIAPMVVNQSSDVAFMISMAGLGVKGVDLIKKQNSEILKSSNLPPEQYKALTGLYFRLFDLVNNQDLNKPLELNGEFEKWKKSQPITLIDSMKMNAGQQGEGMIQSFISAIQVPWMRYFIKYDPAPFLSKIKIPVLALNGSKDIQVSSTENLAGFEKYLNNAGNKNYRIVEFPGLNHLFQTSETGYLNEYATIEETISPTVLQVITDWISLQVK
ncbi:prolyl oligopeptidase family serine peptidase [Flavihumibacter sp. R14]|nr:prolyl oligopeptidase family serine peptidase [Flavihumibacter soli]